MSLEGFKRIALFGATGQLGGAFREAAPHAAWIKPGRFEADLGKPAKTVAWLDEEKPDLVINCASYNWVDRAEAEFEVALNVNGRSVGFMAEWCARQGVPFIHFSTEYVFDGSGEMPWKETDKTSPLNRYGESKLEGERRVQEAGGRFLVFRTSWLFSSKSHNFFNSLLKWGLDKERLEVAHDQVGAPTHVRHLARAVLEILPKALQASQFPSGIYHVANTGAVSRRDYAAKFLEAARVAGFPVKTREVKAVSSDHFPLPAKRPLNSRLDQTKVKTEFGVELPPWEEAMREYLREVSR